MEKDLTPMQKASLDCIIFDIEQDFDVPVWTFEDQSELEMLERSAQEYVEAYAERATKVCNERGHTCREDNSVCCTFYLPYMGICSVFDI